MGAKQSEILRECITGSGLFRNQGKQKKKKKFEERDKNKQEFIKQMEGENENQAKGNFYFLSPACGTGIGL